MGRAFLTTQNFTESTFIAFNFVVFFYFCFETLGEKTLFAECTGRLTESLLWLPFLRHQPLKYSVIFCNSLWSPNDVADSMKSPSHRQQTIFLGIFKPILSVSLMKITKEIRWLADWFGESLFNIFYEFLLKCL